MSDKNLEQRINIMFCVKIGKSASEILAVFTVAYTMYVSENSAWCLNDEFEMHGLSMGVICDSCWGEYKGTNGYKT
jgi:hypothetical protein